MSLFINRTLNLRKIKAIGLDMDYTIVRYNSFEFEKFTYYAVLDGLVKKLEYPASIKALKYDNLLAIQGLVIDKKHGNILKLSRFGQVKESFHGIGPMSALERYNTYNRQVIDLTEPHIQSLDTAFSIANGVLYAQLVQLKNTETNLPSFDILADDLMEMIDTIHKDGTLKAEVKNHLSKYVIQEPCLPPLLEKFKDSHKKLLVITNSDYHYCKILLDHTINPFLKKYKNWSEVFEIVITSAAKPFFFSEMKPFYPINPDDQSISLASEKITSGIFQGGNGKILQDNLGLKRDEILYLGDHIYGDVVALKKTFNWRTALVFDELAAEVKGLKKSSHIQKELKECILEKGKNENKLALLSLQEHKGPRGKTLFQKINSLDKKIAKLLQQYRTHFNPNWGELMRAGQEESRFADQVEKYACVYMSKISDLLEYSPYHSFRPIKRWMPHELGEQPK